MTFEYKESSTLRKEIKSNSAEVTDSASIDFEWIPFSGEYNHNKTKIFAAAFCTNEGKRIVLHISKYQNSEHQNPEKALIQDILFYFNQFARTFGWYTTGIAIYDKKTGKWIKGRDSDFFILHQRCLYYNLESPFELGYNGRYIWLKKNSENKHIDLIKVFEKQLIKDGVFNGKYKTTSLDSVSRDILGISKYNDINAGKANILEKPIEVQKKYVRRDAELVMMLASYNNSLVLRLMKVLSYYAEMDYYKICHTTVSSWYSNKYKRMIKRGDCTIDFTPNYRVEKRKIIGGHHTIPKRGLFSNTKIYELDVKGMYPSIVINSNFSFDTLNCTCCSHDPSAQLNQEIINMINKDLQENNIDRRVSRRWFCKKRKGAFPMILDKVLEERENFLRLLRQEESKPNPNQFLIEEYNTRQLSAKLFANSGFGLFANEYFEFSNYKVAECITAKGRLIHKQMELMAQQIPFNFDIIFGFTDSIFIKVNEIDKNDAEEKVNWFIGKCKEEFGVSVEVKNVFVNSIFYGKKNRFVGFPIKENEKPIIKGLDGLADSNPLWIKKWVHKITEEIIKRPELRFKNVPKLLTEAMFDLKNIVCGSPSSIEKELKFSQKLRYHPNAYVPGYRTGYLGRLLEKDKGEEVYWYETNKIDEKTKCNYSILPPRPEDVNVEKYKGWLLDKLRDTLEIAGFNFEKLRGEIAENTRSLI